VTQLCPTCGAVQRTDPEERAAAEMSLANIMALVRKQPSILATIERELRQWQGLRSGIVRLLDAQNERAANGR